MDYYNNERYQWGLAKLSPNQYAEYLRTGEYPIKDFSTILEPSAATRTADPVQD